MARVAPPTIAAIQTDFADGMSPVALVEECLERIEKHNTSYNAMLFVAREQALEDARQAEAELRAGKRRSALHGIPVGSDSHLLLLRTRFPLIAGRVSGCTIGFSARVSRQTASQWIQSGSLMRSFISSCDRDPRLRPAPIVGDGANVSRAGICGGPRICRSGAGASN